MPADLEFAKFLDDTGPDEHGDEQRRERGKDGAEGEIAEDPEWVEEREQLFVEQPVKQGFSNAGSEAGYGLILLGATERASADVGA